MFHISRILLFAILVPMGLSALHAGAASLKPQDHAAQDSGFMAYRTQFLAAVTRRDVDFVIANTADDVRLAARAGGAALLRKWLTAGGGELPPGDLWGELEKTLRLGGVFTEASVFCTPYLSCVELPGCKDCDPLDMVVVLGRDIPAHAAASRGSRVVARFSHEVLEIDAAADISDEGWLAVRLPDGRTAFMHEDDVRAPGDFRAVFEQSGGEWFLTLFATAE